VSQTEPKNTVSFQCVECKHGFSAEPAEVLPAPELEHHPFQYRAVCPCCDGVAEQIWWERNLMKAHANATGPTSDEGKTRSKYNAVKHMLRSQAKTFYPALPGRYPECPHCEHYQEMGCVEYGGCLKKAELLLKHHIAFEKNDPSILSAHRAETQAHLQALIDSMILTIAQDGGPRIKEPVWYHDKDGGFHLAGITLENGMFQQFHELKPHPLLKPLIDFISKNGLTLSDQGMTPKVQDQNELLGGYLEAEGEKQESAQGYQQRMEDGQNKLMQLIGNSYKPKEPVVIDCDVVEVDG